MKNRTFTSRGRVQVTNYGPFRGLKGIIQNVDAVDNNLEEPFGFYLVALEDATLAEPIWFEHDEIAFIDTAFHNFPTAR